MRGPLAVWGGLLPLLWALPRSPHGVVVAAYERCFPAQLQLARELGRTRPAALQQDSLALALDCVWERCVTVAAQNPNRPAGTASPG